MKKRSNLTYFVLAGGLAYYCFFALGGLLHRMLTSHVNGYDAFEMALFFGAPIAVLFAGLLLIAGFSRRAQFLSAQSSNVIVGAILSACLAVLSYVLLDQWLSERIDQFIAGAVGDRTVPAVALALAAVASIIGVKFATRDA